MQGVRAELRALTRIADRSERYLLTVPLNDPIDEALHPDYLRGFVNYAKLEPGDEIVLRAVDFSWQAEVTVIAMSKSAACVTARLTKTPTFFLLAAAERNSLYLADEINRLTTAHRQGNISNAEHDVRMAVLTSVKDQGCYPSVWVADKLMQLQRARDKGLLTKPQYETAAAELRAVMTGDQAAEVDSLTGAAKAGAHNAGLLAHELAVAGKLVLDGLHAGAHPGLDHAALELGKRTGDLEQQLAHRRGCVDVLLIEVKVNTGGFEVLDGAQEVNQRSPEPIDGKGHHDVEFAPAGILEHGIEAGPLVAALGAADALVLVGSDHIPATALCDLLELADLVLHRLPVKRDANV